MRHLSKVAVLACILSFGSCTVDDTAIYDEPLEVFSTGDEDQDTDDELEPNN